MALKVLAAVVVALWVWVMPVAHTLPLDADGPSGLSDNGDFDDVILMVTAPTVALAPSVPAVIWAALVVLDATLAARPTPISQYTHRRTPTRAPPVS